MFQFHTWAANYSMYCLYSLEFEHSGSLHQEGAMLGIFYFRQVLHGASRKLDDMRRKIDFPL